MDSLTVNFNSPEELAKWARALPDDAIFIIFNSAANSIDKLIKVQVEFEEYKAAVKEERKELVDRITHLDQINFKLNSEIALLRDRLR